MGNKKGTNKRKAGIDMKDLSEMSKSELIQYILGIDSAETENHLKRLSRDMLASFVEHYRRWNKLK